MRRVESLHQRKTKLELIWVHKNIFNIKDIDLGNRQYEKKTITITNYFHFYTVQENKIQSQTANYLQ